MNKQEQELVEKLKDKYGVSNSESRDAVIDAHGGMDSLMIMANLWAENSEIEGDGISIFVAYATAVDMGYRIGKGSGKETQDDHR